MKKKIFILAFVGLWILGFYYCRHEAGSADRSPVNTDSLIEAQLNDTLLLDHSKLEPLNIEDVPAGSEVTITDSGGHWKIVTLPAGSFDLKVLPKDSAKTGHYGE